MHNMQSLFICHLPVCPMCLCDQSISSEKDTPFPGHPALKSLIGVTTLCNFIAVGFAFNNVGAFPV